MSEKPQFKRHKEQKVCYLLDAIFAENRMGIGSVGPTTTALLVATNVEEIAVYLSEHKKF